MYRYTEFERSIYIIYIYNEGTWLHVDACNNNKKHSNLRSVICNLQCQTSGYLSFVHALEHARDLRHLVQKLTQRHRPLHEIAS